MLLAIEFDNLHQVLRALYDDMMPLCSNMTGVAKGIAGIGALFYVAVKVWQALARAEAIDVYPLLRPFAIGLCIMFFPTFVLGTINTVLSPVVRGCNNLLETQTFDMNEYRQQKDRLEYEALMHNPETAYLASDEEFDRQLEELGWSPSDMVTMTGMYMDRAAYSVYTKNANRWVIGGEYLEKRYDYKDVRIPIQQFTAEGGYYLNFLSDRRKTFFLSAGLSALAGYETSNRGNKLLPDGSTLLNKDAFVYGGALTLELETYLTDRMVLLLNVRERAMFGSSIGTFNTQVSIGMKFIIN